MSLSPFLIFLKLGHQEILSLLIISRHIGNMRFDNIMLIIHSFNIFSKLINADLDLVILGIFVVHGEELLVCLLKFALGLFIV